MTAKTEDTFDSLAAAFVQQGLTQGFLRVHFSGASTPPEFEIADLVAYETALRQNRELTDEHPPMEVLREEIRCNLLRLQQAEDDLSERLAAAVPLKTSLRKLEHDAGRCGYEALSRVAAILHDTLKNNPVEALDDAEVQGFLKACEQAIEGQASNADAYVCEKTLFHAGLSWLPTFRIESDGVSK